MKMQMTDEEVARVYLKLALVFEGKKDFKYLAGRFTGARKESLKEQYIETLREGYSDYMTRANFCPESKIDSMLSDREIFIRYNDKKTEYTGLHLLIHNVLDSESLSYEESLSAIGKAVRCSGLFDAFEPDSYSDCFNKLEACLLESIRIARSR